MLQLLDKILSRENMLEVYKQVKPNKGLTSVDDITINEIDNYLLCYWRETKQPIKERRYKPQHVLRIRNSKTEWR